MRRLLVVCGFLSAVGANGQYVAEILPTPNGTGRAVGAGGGQIVGIAHGAGGGPALWDGPSHTYSVLNSGGYSGIEIFGVGGGQQVGYGVSASAHALMWSTLGAPPVNLQPAGYGGSIAFNADGVTQVGVANNGNTSHAVMWQGTAQSAVLLHPVGYENSDARGVSGEVQVGSVAGGPNSDGAVIWRGSAKSMKFLPAPAGISTAGAQGIYGNQVVGELAAGAGSIVWDLDTWTYSLLGQGRAMATNGINQVGFDGPAFEERAQVWAGTEASRLDLHQFLPNGFSRSLARGIDENGSIVGYGDMPGFGQVPIAWKPVPEPNGLLALAIGIGALAMRRRRRR